MRRAAFLVCAVAAAFGLWWIAGGDDAKQRPIDDVAGTGPRADERVHAAARGPERAPLDRDGAREGRAIGDTRCTVVDAATGKPIPNVRVISFRDGSVVARGDRAGTVLLADPAFGSLVFVAEGYLVRGFLWITEDLTRMQREAHAGEVVRVELQKDTWTVPFAFRFVRSDGKPAVGVRARFQSRGAARSSQGGSLLAGSDPFRTAHRSAVWNPVLAGLHYHLGTLVDPRWFECDGELTVRFPVSGEYECEAATSDGQIALQRVDVHPGQTRPFVIRLAAGGLIKGRVLHARTREPVADVEVALLGDSPEESPRSAFTDREGWYGFGPLPLRRVELRFRHPAFEDGAWSSTPGPGSVPDTLLVARPVVPLRGTAVRAGSGAPLIDARVVGRIGRCIVGTTRTTGVGYFQLDLPAGAVSLHLENRGLLPYEESLTHAAGQPDRAFVLYPLDTADRVAAGVSAVLRGRVLGPDGKPAAGVRVELRGVAEPGLAMDGRTVEAGLPSYSRYSASGTDGRWQIEWPNPERVRVAVSNAAKDVGRVVEVVLGRYHEGLDLETPR